MKRLLQYDEKNPEKPEVDEYYIRPYEADLKMKTFSKTKKTVWICGASGSGKTSFVADYLKKVEYEYYSAKSNIAEQIIINHKSQKKRTVVIDDLYGISDPEIQKEWFYCINGLIEQENVWLILISRSQIPGWLYNLSVNHIFSMIMEKDLLLRKEQASKYIDSYHIDLT